MAVVPSTIGGSFTLVTVTVTSMESSIVGSSSSLLLSPSLTSTVIVWLVTPSSASRTSCTRSWPVAVSISNRSWPPRMLYVS